MHRLATVHARGNQPTNQPMTNDQRRHDTAYFNKRLFYQSKVRRLKILIFSPHGFFKLKMYQNQFYAGAPPQTPARGAYYYAPSDSLVSWGGVHPSPSPYLLDAFGISISSSTAPRFTLDLDPPFRKSRMRHCLHGMT